MSDYTGTVAITGELSPKNTEDTYGLLRPKFLIGGWREVDTITDRNNIESGKRTKGMVVKVNQDIDYKTRCYTFTGNSLTNTDWVVDTYYTSNISSFSGITGITIVSANQLGESTYQGYDNTNQVHVFKNILATGYTSVYSTSDNKNVVINSHPNSYSGSTYTLVVTDNYGHVTNQSSMPNTIAGLGVTNVYTMDETITEIENRVSGLASNMIRKPDVATYSAITTTYPTPNTGWTVYVEDTGILYYYGYNENNIPPQSMWYPIGTSTPKVTHDYDGLMWKEDKIFLDALDLGDNNISGQTLYSLLFPKTDLSSFDGQTVTDGIAKTLVNWNYITNKPSGFKAFNSLQVYITSISPSFQEIGTVPSGVTITGTILPNDETNFGNAILRTTTNGNPTDTIISIPSTGTFTYVYTGSPITDTFFQIGYYVADGIQDNNGNYTPNTLILSDSKLLRFTFPMYYGANANILVTNQLYSLTKSNQLNQDNSYISYAKKYSYATTNNYLYFAYPAEYGNLISIITDSNINEIDQFTITQGNVISTAWTHNYYLVRSTNTVSEYNGKIKFVFYDSEDSLSSSDTEVYLGKYETAQDSLRLGGIEASQYITIGSDGKIDPNLLPETSTGLTVTSLDKGVDGSSGVGDINLTNTYVRYDRLSTGFSITIDEYGNKVLLDFTGSTGGGGSTYNPVIVKSYSELSIIANAGVLSTGQHYLISDFQTIHQIQDTNSINTGPIEPIIIQAISNNSFNKNAISTIYSADTIYYDFYNNICEDNSTTRPGKIYYRKDTINNISTYYDFRNVKFRRYLVDCSVTWSSGSTYNKKDLVKYNNIIYNVITSGLTSGSNTSPDNDSVNFIQFLDLRTIQYWSWANNVSNWAIGNTNMYNNSNLVISGSVYNDYYTFDNLSQVNNFELGYINYDFTEYYYNNVVILNCNIVNDNKIGGSSCNCTINGTAFNDNIMNNAFYNNVIGTAFGYNTIGNNFANVIIGDSFGYNTIGNNFLYCSIGNSVSYNTVGNNFSYNSIGNNIVNNTIGDSFEYNTIIGNFQLNTVQDNVNNIDFTSATHVYNGYNTTILYSASNSFKLMYLNSSDILTIVDANS